jgi:hypothetical protein
MKGINIMDIIRIFYLLSLTPGGLVFYSGMFFWFVVEKLTPARTMLFLKCYCMLVMLLAIEALQRSRIYVRVIWGTKEENVILFFLIVSILISYFCFTVLSKKITSQISDYLYVFFALTLIVMIVVFSKCYFSAFEAFFQIISAWGCVSVALYGLWRYAVKSGEIVFSKKQRIQKNMVYLCVALLATMMLFPVERDYKGMTIQGFRRLYANLIRAYNHHNPSTLFELSMTKEVDITDRLIGIAPQVSEYEVNRKITSIASVLLGKNVYSIQFNVEALFYLRRDVPLLGLKAYERESLEDFKKELAADTGNYNSPDFSSPYNGKGNVFFREVFIIQNKN